jgi:hypothetical protein
MGRWYVESAVRGILACPGSLRWPFQEQKPGPSCVSGRLELLGVDLGEHITFLIEALRPHAEELGIQGRGAV